MSQSWLDRFSAHSTPGPSPPPHRSFSPVPRKQYFAPNNPYQSRPSLSQRSSTGSLASETSATRAPPNTRLPYGSSLKNQINAPPPETIQDPLVTLAVVVGKSVDGSTTASGAVVNGGLGETPVNLTEDIDFRGLSLQDFADRSDAQQPALIVEQSGYEQSIEEYQDDKRGFGELHRSILACDDILKSVEKYLSSFQADLGVVSAEIETLQSRSTALNGRLENRRRTEALLGPVIEQISVPPLIVSKIIEGPVDDSWIQALNDLQVRSTYIESLAQDKKQIAALNDLKPLLEDLCDVAVERIRNHLVSQIKSLRSPNINAQIIQQDNILKFKDLYTFLANRQPKLAEDITQAYINTMRWYYQMHFTRYLQALQKLKLYTTDQHDTIGETSTSRRQPRAGLMTGSKSTASAQPDPFSLGRRIDSLKAATASALPSHIAEEEATKPTSHSFETLFLAFNTALVDNACFEYAFLTAFYSPALPHQGITAAFASVFATTLELASNLTKSLTTDSYDALGVLLLVRLTQHFAFTLQRRKVPALESYVNGTNMLLWPRFQQILNGHCESLRRLASSLPSTGSSSDTSSAPHPVTQRFANFLHGILALSSEAGDDEPVANSLNRLRGEYEAFLAKMAGAFGKTEKGRKDQRRFFVNNYSLVLTVVGDARGRLADEQRRYFEQLRSSI